VRLALKLSRMAPPLTSVGLLPEPGAPLPSVNAGENARPPVIGKSCRGTVDFGVGLLALKVRFGLESKTRSRPPPLTVTGPPLGVAIIRSPPAARISKSPVWFWSSPIPPRFGRLIWYTPGVIRSMTLAVGLVLWKEMAARRLGALNPCAVGVTRAGSPGLSASEVTKMVAGTQRASVSSIEGRA